MPEPPTRFIKPEDFAGNAGKYLRVNDAGTALEFVDPADLPEAPPEEPEVP